MPPLLRQNVVRATRITVLAAQATACTHGVLQFNREQDCMVIWHLPGGIRHRKHPDLFRALRETTRMLGPCCLCPLVDENGPDYVEAAMYMATTGPYTGQYVISCANDKCGYLIFLEQLYDRPGVPLKVYEPRGIHERAPPLPLHVSERDPNHQTSGEQAPSLQGQGSSAPTCPSTRQASPISMRRSAPTGRMLRRTYAMLDININESVHRVPALRRGQHTHATLRRRAVRRGQSSLLERLDSRVRPGITEDEFKYLFVRCACGEFFTRRAHRDHTCSSQVIDLTGDVIDLTGDDD